MKEHLTYIIAAAAGIVFLIVLILLILWIRHRKRNAPAEPLPGGGGSYTMYISGMNCEHCKANVEGVLNQFPGVKAAVDLKSESAKIVYSGYPDLEFLDQLRSAVEDAGFTVKEIR